MMLAYLSSSCSPTTMPLASKKRSSIGCIRFLISLESRDMKCTTWLTLEKRRHSWFESFHLAWGVQSRVMCSYMVIRGA